MVQKKNIVAGFLIAATIYFTFFFLFGNYGFLKYSKLQIEKEVKELELQKLAKENEELNAKISSFRNKNINKDLLDEQVRKNLGLTGQDEVVIFYE